MRILLLAHPYLNLYKDIVNELLEQGHDVTVLEESKIPGDPYHKKQNKIKRKLLIWKWEKFKIAKKYWINKLGITELNSNYDLLFVIQGCTFDPILLKHLREYNSKIRTSLYLWDTNRIYDFYRNVKYFDKVFSFDLKDVISDKTQKMKYLPFFWPKSIINFDDMSIKYRISSIGTNHDDRYIIYNRLIRTFKDDKIPFYIKLISHPKQNVSCKEKILFFLNLLLNKKDKIEQFKLDHGIISPDFVESTFYSSNDLCKIMAQSNSILDTDNKLQYGTTPRLIWGLALNKHIYTTNENVKDFPFYNEKFIHIISREKPQINWEFLQLDNSECRESIIYLRIDNWVKNFL